MADYDVAMARTAGKSGSMHTHSDPNPTAGRSAVVITIVLLAGAALTGVVVGLKMLHLGPFSLPPSPREAAAAFLASLSDTQVLPGTGEGQSSAPLFTDIAPSVGLVFHHDNALYGDYLLPGEMGPGAGFLDFDNDGDLDIFVAGGGTITGSGTPQTCRLFRNDGERFTDVTDDYNAAVPGSAFGVICADIDHDGDTDVFVTRLGPNVLLRNDNTSFVDISDESGVGDPLFGTSAAFFDYDNDGLLDLYVANYVEWSLANERQCYSFTGLRDYCSPTVYDAPSTDRLYKNLGSGRFEDRTESSGISSRRGNGLGVVAADFDQDGWMDLYVANDMTPAFLWHNNGDGTFTDIAEITGSAYDARGVAISGMGVAAEDLDSDGDVDLFVTNIGDQNHLILRNDRGYFTDVSLRFGVGSWSIPATGFGVVVFDQDHDGKLDLFIANGAVNFGTDDARRENPYSEPDHFARLLDGKFVDRTSEFAARFDDVGRAAACGDVDNDGDLDLLVTNNGGPLRLLRNNNNTNNAWLIVDVRNRPDGSHALGARVEVVVDGRRYFREVRPHSSYLSSHDPRVHFGLGPATVVNELIVTFPDGTQHRRHDVPINQVIVIAAETDTLEAAN